MDLSIPLNKMTIADKSRAIEEIWADLAREADSIPSPAWHADILNAREQRVKDGHSHLSDWEEAKSRMRKQA